MEFLEDLTALKWNKDGFMWWVSARCVFLLPDTKNGNQDTKFILKDQQQELGTGNLDLLFILLLKMKKKSPEL